MKTKYFAIFWLLSILVSTFASPIPKSPSWKPKKSRQNKKVTEDIDETKTSSPIGKNLIRMKGNVV